MWALCDRKYTIYDAPPTAEDTVDPRVIPFEFPLFKGDL